MTARPHELVAATFSGSASSPGPRRSSPPAGGTAAAFLEPKLRGVQPAQRLGGREDPALPLADSRTSIRPASERLRDGFRRTRSPGTGGGSIPPHRRTGRLDVSGLVRAPQRLTLHDARGAAGGDLHGQAPLRGGLDRDRHLDRRAGLGRSPSWLAPLPDARYLRFDSFDSGYSNGWDLASAMHPQTILAYAFNDRPLTRERGAPLRLYSPIKLGYKMTKYVSAMTLHPRTPRRVLGGPGLSLARRGLVSFARWG